MYPQVTVSKSARALSLSGLIDGAVELPSWQLYFARYNVLSHIRENSSWSKHDFEVAYNLHRKTDFNRSNEIILIRRRQQRHDTDGYNYYTSYGYCTYRNRSDDVKVYLQHLTKSATMATCIVNSILFSIQKCEQHFYDRISQLVSPSTKKAVSACCRNESRLAQSFQADEFFETKH